jgi:hypothetical protein
MKLSMNFLDAEKWKINGEQLVYLQLVLSFFFVLRVL